MTIIKQSETYLKQFVFNGPTSAGKGYTLLMKKKKEQNDKFYIRFIFYLNKFSQAVLELVI